MAYRSKRTMCIRLRKPRHTEPMGIVNVTPKENFSLGEALESVYPLLDIVCSYLGRDDLKSVAKVGKSWAAVAERVLGRRTSPSWISASRNSSKTFVKYSDNYSYDNVEVGFVLVNHRVVSMSDKYCCHESEDFCPVKLTKFSDILATRVVPPDVKYCVISCDCPLPLSPNKHPYKGSVPLFVGCFIPKIPNVHVSMFYCDPNNMRDDHIDLANTKLRCMLLFCKSDLKRKIYDVLECLLPYEDCCTEVAIGGGIIHKTTVYPQRATITADDRTSKSNFCITFAEDRNCSESCFSASSVVISGASVPAEKFEAELMRFKERIVIRNNSLAFRICCAAKMRKSQEGKIFKNVFPNTPLMGLEAGGEIGWNCFHSTTDSDNDFQEQKTKKSKLEYPMVQHQWSTVIVFTTWGHVVNHPD